MIPVGSGEVFVANGDSGRVVAVDEKTKKFVVEFDNVGAVWVPFRSHYLVLAYAVTIHKAQGSSVRVAIVPVLDEFAYVRRGKLPFWSRELCYTAVSRTADVLVTVGESEAIRKAISSQCRDRRRTLLANFLRE
jgi:exodeoxyribonuclease V alpha subunit